MGDEKAPNFRKLEEVAGRGHMRSHYAWASHEVHADAKSWLMNVETVGDRRIRSTSASPRGLADPGHMGLLSLLQVASNALNSPPDGITPGGVLQVGVLTQLVDRAGDAFLTAHERVEAELAAGI